MRYKNLKMNRLVAVTLFLGILLLPISIRSEGQIPIPRGGSLRITLGSEPRVASPYTGSWSAGIPASQIFSSLLAFDNDLNPTIPSLATELPEINEVEGSYTFKLRSGVKWHDGKPFTAEDVKFTFEEMMQYDIFGAAYFDNTIVDIIDASTVKITPGNFWPGIQMPLFAGLDTSITPKHILEGIEDYSTDQFNFEPIGTGPFKFKEWVQGSYIILERFEDYWASPAPYLDEVVIRIINDPAMMLAAFQTNEADYQFRGLPYESYDTLKANPELNVITHTRPPYKAMLSFNHKSEHLDDIKVRQAIAYALDRTTMANLATNGLCQVTNTFWTPDIASPSPGRTIYTYDPDKAKNLLEDAGYKADAAGNRDLTIELLTRTGEAEEALLGDLIEDYLSEVGITVARKVVDFSTQLSLTSNYDYEMSLTKRWVMTFWTYQLFHSDWIIPGRFFANSVQLNNSEMDATFDAWLVETDPVKQRELLQKVDDIATEVLPQLPLYDLVWINVIRKTFQPVPGAELGTLPDCRYVFWDTLENTFWTEGTIPVTTVTVITTVPFGPAKWLWISAFLTLTVSLITNRRRRKAN